MARQQGTVVENNFIKGLITEATALSFPENSCTEALNVDFDLTGRVSKRLGFDFETAYNSITTDNTGTDAITEYIWKSVGGDGDRAFMVLQKGRYLYFYDVSSSSDVSPNYLRLTIDLNTYKPSSTDLVPSLNPCGYTSGNGDLVVVNQACNPFYVIYAASTGTLTATAISIKVRDFRGLGDGLGIDERPTASVATLISGNPAHYYNLANQGWLTGDALTQWDTALATMPSNADYISLFRSSATDSFDATIVTSKTGYNTPAPKGHYILDAWQPDRTIGGTLTFSATLSFPQLVNDTSLTRIGDTTSAFIYDGLTAVSSSSCAAVAAGTAWFGNNLGSAVKISKAIIYGSSDYGFVRGTSGGGFVACISTTPVTAYLYGKATNPASATDGTLLGQITFTNTSNESAGREIVSSDTTNTYQYVWVYFVFTNYGFLGDGVCSRRIFIGEMDTYQYVVTTVASSDDINTYHRPSTTEFYQGRIFYSGVIEQNLGSNIYFSQIAEKRDQYGLCYQKNDPTSEDLSDLLADDGGVIKIPDAGNIIRLFEFQGALLVLATNGVWIIQGSAGAPFLATDYEVKKISASGTNSPLSVASYRGVPVWWGREGILTVQYDANYSSFTVNNLSNTTIQSVIDAVPNLNKSFVKGACDPVNFIVYWLYNDSANLATADNYKYDMLVCLNMQTGSFTLYNNTGTPAIRGVVWVPDNANNTSPAQVKFTVSEDVLSAASTPLTMVTFAELTDDVYTDWGSYADGVETPSNYSTATKLNDATSQASAGYDGTTTQAKAACVTKTSATSIYFGYTRSTALPLTRALVWGSSDAGYVNAANPVITMRLYGKTGSAPANGTDGTQLATITFTDSADESLLRRELISNDPITLWDHVWVYVSQAGGAATMYIAEVQFFKRVADATKEISYDAYFTTGYRLDGQALKFFQPNYIMVYLNTVANSSCTIQPIYDFTNSASSNKWGTVQQLYNSALLYRDTNYRRIKLRGKGRALQMKFQGEGSKPFEIIGWTVWATANAGV